MSKRNYVKMVSIILGIGFVLTGCGNNQQQAELQKKYDDLASRYDFLKKDYNELKSSNMKLQEEYQKLQDLPDISVSIIDDRDEVVDLTLHSSLEASQKSYTQFYHQLSKPIPTKKYSVTITCNNGEKINDIYWVYSWGEIESYMDKVNNLDNIYTFQIEPGFRAINSIIIKCNNKTMYTSLYETNEELS